MFRSHKKRKTRLCKRDASLLLVSQLYGSDLLSVMFVNFMSSEVHRQTRLQDQDLHEVFTWSRADKLDISSYSCKEE